MLAATPSLDYKFLIICSPGTSYYSKSLSVYIEDKYSRAAPGGAGYAKAAGNYGAAFYPTSLAMAKGFDQVVWTDSISHQKIEEVGTKSIAFRILLQPQDKTFNDQEIENLSQQIIELISKTFDASIRK